MPTIFRRSNGIYYLLFRERGKSRWMSTGKRSKGEALSVLLDLDRRRTEDTSAVQTASAASPATLQAFLSEFLCFADSNYSAKTKQMYRRTLERFFEFTGEVPLTSISARHVDGYKALRAGQISGVSLNIELRTLKAAFNVALRWGMVSSNPCKGVRMQRVLESEPTYLTREDISNLLAEVRHGWLRDIVIIACSTGLRRSELLNLRWEDVSFEDRLLRIRNHGTFRTKTGKNRTVPMNTVVFDRLLQRQGLSGGEMVFTRNGYRISPEQVSRRFKQAARRAGLGARVHFHSLRHTFASWLVQNGTSIYEVQKLLGHCSIKVTQVYSHLAPTQLHAAVDRLSHVVNGAENSMGRREVQADALDT